MEDCDKGDPTMEEDDAIDELDPFLSAKEAKSPDESEDDLRLFILNTFRSLFDNDNFVLTDISDRIDAAEVEATDPVMEGLRS